MSSIERVSPDLSGDACIFMSVEHLQPPGPAWRGGHMRPGLAPRHPLPARPAPAGAVRETYEGHGIALDVDPTVISNDK